MQFLTFIPRYFARRKAVAEQRARLYEPMIHEGGAVLEELQGMREDARCHAQEMIHRMGWLREKLNKWDGEGMPAAREEFDALCPTAAARENALRAQKSAEGARAAAGLPCEGKDFSTDAPVFDEDHLQIMGILGVNAKAGWVLVADLPVQLTEHGHIKSRRLRFKKIVQFDPNGQSSGSFHCYGRLPDPQ